MTPAPIDDTIPTMIRSHSAEFNFIERHATPAVVRATSSFLRFSSFVFAFPPLLSSARGGGLARKQAPGRQVLCPGAHILQ